MALNVFKIFISAEIEQLIKSASNIYILQK